MSISHHCASLDQLQVATLDSQEAAVSELLAVEGVTEAFVLQTCNRVETYVVTDETRQAQEVFTELTRDVSDAVVEQLNHEEGLRHLLCVAAGLESLVLGEDQILGQVRGAYEDARRAGGLGPVLEDAVTKAIHVGERARTETAINEGVVSLASAAVRLASETYGLTETTAAVVGTGEMGTLAAKRLADQVDQLVLVNRTVERAESLATTVESADIDVSVAGLDALPRTVEAADVVISATASPDYVVDVGTFHDVGETLVIDITRPRDIPPAVADLPHVTVYDLDRLETVTEKTRQQRQEAARHVEQLVDEEFDRLLAQYKRKRADQVISAMYASGERIKSAELEQAFRTLDLDESEQEVIEAMANAIVSQLLAAPTDSLRDAAEEDDWTTIHTALQLFDPSFGPESDVITPEFLSNMGDVSDDVPE